MHHLSASSSQNSNHFLSFMSRVRGWQLPNRAAYFTHYQGGTKAQLLHVFLLLLPTIFLCSIPILYLWTLFYLIDFSSSNYFDILVLQMNLKIEIIAENPAVMVKSRLKQFVLSLNVEHKLNRKKRNSQLFQLQTQFLKSKLFIKS